MVSSSTGFSNYSAGHGIEIVANSYHVKLYCETNSFELNFDEKIIYKSKRLPKLHCHNIFNGQLFTIEYKPL